MIVKEFDLAWPSQVFKALNVFSIITSSQEIVFSVECFLLKSGLEINFERFPTIYIKTIVYALFPIIIGTFAAVAWYCIHYVIKKFSQRVTQVKNNIRVTYYIISFISYPMILSVTFSLFNCL